MSSTMELFIGGTSVLLFLCLLNWLWAFRNDNFKSGWVVDLLLVWLIAWIGYVVYHFVSKYW